MTLLPQDIIRKKRDGGTLSVSEITQFVSAVTNGSFSDGQIAAMTMAIFLNGMDDEETTALTLAMRDSGDVLKWPEIDAPIIDKHSTGGVGDNVSLMLAPLAAACGLAVPMISGRGLGHTGGTLDKLESIPGYQVSPRESLFRKTVKDVGCAIISASQNFAPADEKIYAIRDVTATVESVPLIVASILSKKLAAGLEGLVLDVKCGDGATTCDLMEARMLAEKMVDVGKSAGMPTSALLTDMNAPLADAIGNGLEVQNAIDFLTGTHQTSRLKQVVLDLAAHMLMSGQCADNLDQARQLAVHKLDDGSAAEKFQHMVVSLGGPSDLVENYHIHLPKAAIVRPIPAPLSGYIYDYKTRDVAMAIVRQGGGRAHPNDQLDYAVGLSNLLPIGSQITAGDPLVMAHVQSEDQFNIITKEMHASVMISDREPRTCEPVIEFIAG